MLKVLIIEDEPFAQNELKRLLQNTGYPHQVLACIESVEDAVEWFSTHDLPELVFMDIQLADGLSFEIFTRTTINVPVIFTTAYDAYAIQAFKINSIDYLLKPVEQQALNNALQKHELLNKQRSPKEASLSLEQLNSLLNVVQASKEYKSKMLVKSGDQLKFIALNEVAYFYSEDNEVLLMTQDKKRYVVDFSIDQLAGMVNPKLFFRLNRGYLANKDSIVKVHKHFNSRLKIELVPQPAEEVLISRVKVSDFLEWMEL
ncbi:MAG: LytTR family DNA-binding domain-containing protein [Salinivirgaceae bacterium]